MLVIERKKGQRVMVNDDLVITITNIDKHGSRVKIGFEAPLNYVIHREEIYDIIQKEKTESL